MLDTQDAESRVQLGCCAYRPVRREGPDIKALGTRIGCRVDERMTAQYDTKGFHKLSCYLRCNLERHNTVTKVPSQTRLGAGNPGCGARMGSVLGRSPKVGISARNRSGAERYGSPFLHGFRVESASKSVPQGLKPSSA